MQQQPMPHKEIQEFEPHELSRRNLLEKLANLGIKTSVFESLTLDELFDLHQRLNNLTSATFPQEQKERGAHINPVLSHLDKKVLKLLLASNGDISSMALSKELGIPLTTIQRRRKKIAEFLDVTCSLALRKLGLRSIIFFVATKNGMSANTAKEILTWPGVVSVSRTFSNSGIDIKAEVILKTNREIIDFSDKVKTTDGVKDVFWIESIELLGRRGDVLCSAVDSL
jgi:DNA-binding Lrp family transcriptional regulator